MIKKILVILALFGLVVFATFYFFDRNVRQVEVIKETQEMQTQSFCLHDDELANFEIEPLGKYPSPGYDEGMVRISVKQITTGKEIVKFEIGNVESGNYHPVELHKCGVYIIRGFNFDNKKFRPLPGFRRELWFYNYGWVGKKIITLAGESKDGISDAAGVPGTLYAVDYSYDFRVDPLEKYIILEKGYLGKDDYSLVIKDLRTLKDAFMLSLADIAKKKPNFAGSFGMRQWTKDGKYFWGDIFDGADVLAVFRIDSATWKWEVFEVPPYTMGGTALNAEYGYITYSDGPPWTGDAEFDQINKAKWLKEGKKLHFYLYSVFTKEKTLLTTADDPLWSFKPEWLSDTKLQYELPSGEKKVYETKK